MGKLGDIALIAGLGGIGFVAYMFLTGKWKLPSISLPSLGVTTEAPATKETIIKEGVVYEKVPSTEVQTVYAGPSGPLQWIWETFHFEPAVYKSTETTMERARRESTFKPATEAMRQKALELQAHMQGVREKVISTVGMDTYLQAIEEGTKRGYIPAEVRRLLR